MDAAQALTGMASHLEHPTRPLCQISLAWFAGLLAAGATRAGDWQAYLALASFALASVIAALCYAARAERAFGRATLAWLAGAAFTAGLSNGPPLEPTPAIVPAGVARIEAVVEHVEPGSDGARSILRVLRGARVEDGAVLTAGTLLTAMPLALPEGARLRVLAKLTPHAPFRNPTPHPSVGPRFATAGSAFIAGEAAVQLLEQSWSARALDFARARVRASLDTSLPPRAAGVARALVLGDGQALDTPDLDDIRGAGLLHALAVSGLHVAILAGLCVAILRAALLRCAPIAARFEAKRVACAIGAPLAPLYAAFAGGAPSAWRAALTAATAWTLYAAGRRPDALATTAFAALALGVFDPSLVTRPAFLLSIVATASLLSAPVHTARGLSAMLKAAFTESLRATLATAPIVLWCFGSVPIAGVLANVVLLPFASLVLVQLSALHALACTLTPFGAPTAAAFGLVSDAFLSGCGLFARLVPNRAWPPPDVAQGLLISAGVIGLLACRERSTQLLTVLGCVVGLCALELALRAREQPHGRLRITFLDVGQGDATLIDLPDGTCMLIDAGGSIGGGLDPGKYVLWPLLQARRRARIELAVLTHPHPDHYGGFGALLANLPITELWDTGQAAAEHELQATSAEAAQLINDARARGTRVRGPAELCGRSFVHAGARIRVLAPCPRFDPGYDANDNSLVLRIDYGTRSFLFAGDAEQHTEARLLEHPGALRADVLKVAHHGSRTSTSPAFLAAVAPRFGVISAGACNHFGHPHAEVLARLRALPHLARLDQDGGTIVESDGAALHARSWSGRDFWF